MADGEDLRGKGCGTEVQGKAEALDAPCGGMVPLLHTGTRQPACVLTQWPQKGNLYYTVSLRLDQAGTQKNSCGQRVWWMPGRLPSLYQDKQEKAQVQSVQALNWPRSPLYLHLENNYPY